MQGHPSRIRWHSLGLPALLGAALAAAPGPAGAETQLGDVIVSGELEAGYQAIAGDHDSAKFDEYRDTRHHLLRGHFLMEDVERQLYLRGLFDDVGTDAERYELEGGYYNRFGFEAFFSELPHNESFEAESPYFGFGSEDLALPSGFVRGPADLTNQVSIFATGEDVEHRTLTARGGAWYKPLPGVHLSAGYRLLDKEGTQFLGGLSSGFGSFGANFALFPSPIDEKIHEVKADAAVQRDGYSFNFNYTGSFFNNEFKRLAVDNPLIDPMAAPGNGSSRWQMATEPDNSAQQFTFSGSLELPTEFPMRLNATGSWGMRIQDDDFLPATVNSFVFDPSMGVGLGLIPSQGDLDGKVYTWLAQTTLMARPTPKLNVEASYRYYRFDNESDRVFFDSTVANDTGPESTQDRYSVPNEYFRQNVDGEVSYLVTPKTRLGFGWDWELYQRKRGREVRRTNEQGPNAYLNYRVNRWAQVRADYAYKSRTRTGYDPFRYLDATEPGLTQDEKDILVFSELRKFPQADRRLHEANLSAQFVPHEKFSFGVSGGLSYADYHESDYGLEDDERWHAGIDAAYTPFDWLDVSWYYTYDWSLLRMQSRQRGVVGGVVVEQADWSSRLNDRSHNVGADATIVLVPDEVDLILSYAFQRGRGRQHSGSADPATVPAPNFPTIDDTLNLATATVQWRVDEHLSFKWWFGFEKWSHDDFQFDGVPLVVGNQVFLGNEVDDYKAYLYGTSVVFKF